MPLLSPLQPLLLAAFDNVAAAAGRQTLSGRVAVAAVGNAHVRTHAAVAAGRSEEVDTRTHTRSLKKRENHPCVYADYLSGMNYN